MLARRIPRGGRLVCDGTMLFVCDVQEIFRPLIYNYQDVIHTSMLMLQASNILGMKAVITEQYPERFGATVNEVRDIALSTTPPSPIYSKTKFSMVTPEVKKELDDFNIRSVILCGIETHVCVQQTTMDLSDIGIEVHILVDGVSSMRELDRSVALQRMMKETDLNT